jgi:hypothetical protein
MTTEQECIEALQSTADKLGKSPSKQEYEDVGVQPASATVIRTFGGWNTAKEAAGLETSFSTGVRTEDRPTNVELPEGLDWQELTVDQRWYYRNKAMKNGSKCDRRAELRVRAARIKSERGCDRCGESDPGCLDFHHRSGEEKVLSVSKTISHRSAWAPVQTEIDKCDVLCANCHRKEHYQPPVGYSMRDIVP